MTVPVADRGPRRRSAVPGGGRWSYLGLVGLALFALLPIAVSLMNSVKSEEELRVNPLGWPRTWQLENYVTAWTTGGMGAGLGTSAVLVAGTIGGVWLVAGPAAYALARLPMRGAVVVQLYLVAGAAIPVQMFLVPLFFLWTRIGLYDTLPGLVVIYTALNAPFATLLLRALLVAIPRDLDEAAAIDGANSWQVFSRIVLPLAVPAFLTVGLVAGLAAYNEFLFAITFISDTDRFPVSTVFFEFQQGYSSDYSLINAAAALMLLPPLALFLLLQRRFTAGLTGSAVKG